MRCFYRLIGFFCFFARGSLTFAPKSSVLVHPRILLSIQQSYGSGDDGTLDEISKAEQSRVNQRVEFDHDKWVEYRAKPIEGTNSVLITLGVMFTFLGLLFLSAVSSN
jgi:hypothetical protein